MSTMICDLYDDVSDFGDIMEAADLNAKDGWEMDFVSDMRDRFEQYGAHMYLSEKQREILERIAGA